MIRLSGPKAVLETIPTLVGFMPDESVVVIMLRGDGSLICSMRIDLNDTIWWPQVVVQMLSAGAERFISVVISNKPTLSARLWVPGFEAEGIRCQDDLWYSPALKQAGSFMCDQPGCCPFDVDLSAPTVIPALGVPGRSRDEVVAACEYVGPDLADVNEPACPDFWTIEEAVDILRGDAMSPGRPGEEAETAMAVIYQACQSILGRDAFLGHACSDLGRVIRRETLVAMAQRTRDPHMLAALSALAYIAGGGVEAWAMLDRARAIEDTSLCTLLEYAYLQGVSPSMLSDAFTEALAQVKDDMGAGEPATPVIGDARA